MVRLQGPKSRCGVNAVLGKEESPQSLSYLLRPYLAETFTPPDAIEKALDSKLEAARRSIADARLVLEVVEQAKDSYGLALNLEAGSTFEFSSGVTGECRPITVAGGLGARRFSLWTRDGPEFRTSDTGGAYELRSHRPERFGGGPVPEDKLHS